MQTLLLQSPEHAGFFINWDLEPTIRFYEDILGPERAVKFIVSNSQMRGGVLACNLTGRLIPRCKMMISAGMTLDETNTLNMCHLSNVKFERWMAENLDGMKKN